MPAHQPAALLVDLIEQIVDHRRDFGFQSLALIVVRIALLDSAYPLW